MIEKKEQLQEGKKYTFTIDEVFYWDMFDNDGIEYDGKITLSFVYHKEEFKRCETLEDVIRKVTDELNNPQDVFANPYATGLDGYNELLEFKEVKPVKKLEKERSL